MEVEVEVAVEVEMEMEDSSVVVDNVPNHLNPTWICRCGEHPSGVRYRQSVAT